MLKMRKEEDYRISQTMKIGQLCYKLAGRESKKPCVVVDVVDDNFVIINCKIILKGISRMIQSKFRNLSKSEKKPSRMYGGLLCSKCARRKIIESVRQ